MATKKKTAKKAAKKTAKKIVLIDGVDTSSMTMQQIDKHIEHLENTRQAIRSKAYKEREAKAKPLRDKLAAIQKLKNKVEFTVQLPISFTIDVESADYPYVGGKGFDNLSVSAKAKLGGAFEPKIRRFLQDVIDDIMDDVCEDILHLAPKKALPQEVLSHCERLNALGAEAKKAGLDWGEIC